MSLTSLARRTVALTATTALMSGGLASGVLATSAHAAIPPATITKIAPSSWDNRSKVTATLTGTGFQPGDKVLLQPACSDDPALPVPQDAPCAPLTGPEVGQLSYTSNSGAPNATTLTVSLDLSMAPPGRYHVVVQHSAPDNTQSSPFDYFKVFAYGSANATSTVAGSGTTATDPILNSDCETVNSGCGRFGPLPLDVKGSNFAIGAKVEFVKESDQTVDAGLPFVPGNPSNGDNDRGTAPNHDNTGYPSATVIQGDYDTLLKSDLTASFTPGWHDVRVVNTDGKNAGSTARFAQPYFAPVGSLSFPTAADPNPAPSDLIGQGAKNRVLKVTGAGFLAGSTLSVEKHSTLTCADVSVGPSTLGGLGSDGLYTTISAPLTFADCSSPNNTARQVGVSGPDGGRFFRSGFLRIGGSPTFTKFSDTQYATLGQGAHEGFDGVATDGIFVTGSNFEGAGETDPAKMTSFSFGPGVTATTRAVNPTGASAFIEIDVAPDAGTGERTVTATNPDGGATTSDCKRLASGGCDPSGAGPLFKITVGPKVTKVEVAPDSLTASMSPGQALPTKYDVTGSGFEASGYAGDQFIVALPGQTTQDPKIQLQAIQRTSATAVTFQASALAGAAPGPRDLIIENDDHGRVVCAACLGIDSISVSPGSEPNNAVTPPISLSVLVDGLPPLTSASTVSLTHQTPLIGQPAIPGTSVTASDAKHGSAIFDITHAALGHYNVTVVLDPAAGSPTIVSCVGCFTVTGQALALDATAPVSPSTGGQGVLNRLLTFKGMGFTKGMTVSIPDVTVHDVTYRAATSDITALVDIASDAPTGAKTGTVIAGDGTSKTFTFTVDAAPTITSSSPAAYGAGAGSPGSPTPAPQLTVMGQGFVTDPATQVVLGTGIDATDEAVTKGSAGIPPIIPPTDDKDVANLVIAQNAPFGKRAVTVVNDDGGVGVLADGFTVNPGPKVSSVANSNGQPVLCRPSAAGCTNPQSITVLGSDFPAPVTDADKAAAFKLQNNDGTDATGVTVSNVVFSAGKITADVTVDATRPYGPLRIAIFNAPDKGFGSCDTCLYVANRPGSPAPLTLTPGAHSLKATWHAAAPNGAPVTTYHVAIVRSGTTLTPTAVDVSGTTLTYTFTGLLNGATYKVGVAGVNAAGVGAPALATGTAGLPAVLTVAASPKALTYGSKVTLSGRLTGTGGVALAGKTLVLSFVPTLGSAYTRTVVTSSTGAWVYGLNPPYSFKVQALWPGDASYRPASSPFAVVSVAARVLKTSPTSGSKSSHTTVLTIKGTVSPNKHGRVVYLYRYVSGKAYLIQRATLTSTSTFTFSGKPAKGTYTFRVYIPATPGNAAGYSAYFTLYRT